MRALVRMMTWNISSLRNGQGFTSVSSKQDVTEARDDNGNTPIFNFVSAVKGGHQYETNIPPKAEYTREFFTEYNVQTVNTDGDELLHVVARRDPEIFCYTP